MKFIYNTFLILAVSSFLFACESIKMKKKADSGEEFLIEKKDPLVLPPDFSKLPKPNEQPETMDNDINIKSVLDGNQNSTEGDNNQNSSKSNIKKSISEKIQKQ